MGNTLWFVLGAIVGGLLTTLGRPLHSSLKDRIQRESGDTAPPIRLASVKKKLRDYAFRADQMYETVLAERVEIERANPRDAASRPLNIPDVRAWHLEVQSFIDRELGTREADEFAKQYGHWEQYDFSDLSFVMSFLGKKKNSVLSLAKGIVESDLRTAQDPTKPGRLNDPKWQCLAGTVLPALLALLMVAAFELLA